MASCSFCGEEVSGMPYTCNECDETHCGSHRLPERHECRGLARVADRGDGDGAFISRGDTGRSRGNRPSQDDEGVISRALDAVLTPFRRFRRG